MQTVPIVMYIEEYYIVIGEAAVEIVDGAVVMTGQIDTQFEPVIFNGIAGFTVEYPQPPN